MRTSNSIDALPTNVRRRIRVDANGCWLWLGALDGGYGQFQFVENGQRRNWRAHRLVPYLLGYPLGENQHHPRTCPKRCVNPEHLVPMTASEHSTQHTKEFCKHGHPMADAYLVRRSSGQVIRMCSHCLRERGRRRRAALSPEQRGAEDQERTARRRRARATQ